MSLFMKIMRLVQISASPLSSKQTPKFKLMNSTPTNYIFFESFFAVLLFHSSFFHQRKYRQCHMTNLSRSTMLQININAAIKFCLTWFNNFSRCASQEEEVQQEAMEGNNGVHGNIRATTINQAISIHKAIEASSNEINTSIQGQILSNIY